MGAFGERLKREREKRKISLNEVAQATKIGTRYLCAIEEEKFDKLPGGIFNKGFVKAYARHLGLNEIQAVADYNEAFRASHPEELTPVDLEAADRKIMEQRALRVQQERRRIERIPWGKAAVALLLFAFALAVWGAYSHFIKPTGDQVAVEQETIVPQETHSQTSPKSLPRPAALRSNSLTEKPPSTSDTTSSNPQEADATTAGTFRVAIHAREDSWIHIQADGKDLLEDTLAAEAQKSILASNQLVIKAGNIGALDFWFNGQKLPVQGDLDQVKTVTFDSAGLVSSAPKAQSISAAVAR